MTGILHMLIVVLFTIAGKWTQPRCPATDGWRADGDAVQIYSQVLIRCREKHKIMKFAGKWVKFKKG